MWTVLESKVTTKALKTVPSEIREKWNLWLATVQHSGPEGLRAFAGFRDEALSGKWKGFRSSTLNLQWRVIYRVERDIVTVYVVDVSPSDYRRR